MEIKKVICIVAVVLFIAAFAVKPTTHILFHSAAQASDIPIAVMLALCLALVWRDTPESENLK